MVKLIGRREFGRKKLKEKEIPKSKILDYYRNLILILRNDKYSPSEMDLIYFYLKVHYENSPIIYCSSNQLFMDIKNYIKNNKISKKIRKISFSDDTFSKLITNLTKKKLIIRIPFKKLRTKKDFESLKTFAIFCSLEGFSLFDIKNKKELSNIMKTGHAGPRAIIGFNGKTFLSDFGMYPREFINIYEELFY